MSVRDRTTLGIFGRAPNAGVHELFPQADLKVAPAKTRRRRPPAGNQVEALAPGQDTIDVIYRDKLTQQVQVERGQQPVYRPADRAPQRRRSMPARPCRTR